MTIFSSAAAKNGDVVVHRSLSLDIFVDDGDQFGAIECVFADSPEKNGGAAKTEIHATENGARDLVIAFERRIARDDMGGAIEICEYSGIAAGPLAEHL